MDTGQSVPAVWSGFILGSQYCKQYGHRKVYSSSLVRVHIHIVHFHETIFSGSSRQLTLKKGAPGDQVWDLLCVQLASYLERGPLMWMMPLHLQVNQKSNYDDMRTNSWKYAADLKSRQHFQDKKSGRINALIVTCTFLKVFFSSKSHHENYQGVKQFGSEGRHLVLRKTCPHMTENVKNQHNQKQYSLFSG